MKTASLIRDRLEIHIASLELHCSRQARHRAHPGARRGRWGYLDMQGWEGCWQPLCRPFTTGCGLIDNGRTTF